MSTQTRKYELKARAESQRETRDRIAGAAAELHEEKGVARTTVAEIARRADVTRLTVYNHFADLSELLPACAAHYGAQHRRPTSPRSSRWTTPASAPARRWPGYTAGIARSSRCSASSSATAPPCRSSIEFMAENIDRMQAQLADALAAPFAGRGKRAERRKALIRLALDFWTWRRLSREGLDDEAAAELMAAAIAA